MRKILLCISILGLIGYLLFEFLLKNKVPGNFKIPLCLFILGLIYAPYIIGCFLDKKTDKLINMSLNHLVIFDFL